MRSDFTWILSLRLAQLLGARSSGLPYAGGVRGGSVADAHYPLLSRA